MKECIKIRQRGARSPAEAAGRPWGGQSRRTDVRPAETCGSYDGVFLRLHLSDQVREFISKQAAVEPLDSVGLGFA